MGAETRPGCWLSSGDSVLWDVPPGPPRRIEGACGTALAGTPPGRLEIRLLAGGKGPAGAASPVAVTLTPAAKRWSSWAAELPGSGAPVRIEVTYRAESEGSAPRSLFLTEPTLAFAHRRPPRTILLFVVDTLRTDHVSGYGYGRPTTPRLDRYFQDGLRAEACLSPANWTLPAHASLLTSTSVARHGVGRQDRILLPDGLETLAEGFQRAGFRTLAVSGGGYVDPAFGFRRGFDRFAVEYGPAARAVEKALSMLRDYADEPIFLFLHTYQLHDYAPDEAAARELFPDLEALGPDWRGNIGALRARLRTDPSVIPWFGSRYDAALRSVDAAFGRLLAGLEGTGRLERTAAIFTSDHGENLCDRTVDGVCLGWGHGSPFLYDEEIAVPLEVRIPWMPGARGVARNNTTLLDVAPTLLEAAGCPIPASFEGRSLLSPGSAAERVVATEAPPLDALAVREGRFKLIRRTGESQAFRRPPRFHLDGSWLTGRPFPVLPAEQCFDLSRDPGEAHPVPCESAWGARLRDAVDRYLVSIFPGSLVLRVPARVPGSEDLKALVRARGRGKAPTVRSFGLASPPTLAWKGPSVEARFPVGPAPIWLAFEPADRSGAIEIEVSGLDPLVAAVGRDLPPGSYRWRDLFWQSDRALPPGVAVLTTPLSAAMPSSSAPLPSEVVRRLRTLGYLSGDSAPAADPGISAGAASEEGPPLVPGEVRVRRAS